MKISNKLTMGSAFLIANLAGCQPGATGKQAESADAEDISGAQCSDHTPENSGISEVDINEVRRVITTAFAAEDFADRYCPNHRALIKKDDGYYVITRKGEEVDLAKAITLQIKGELPHPIDMRR